MEMRDIGRRAAYRKASGDPARRSQMSKSRGFRRGESRATRSAGALAAGAALLLAGCTVGPDFFGQKTEVKSYDQPEKLAVDGSPEASQHLEIGKKVSSQWWRLLRSPPLDQVLQ